MSAVSREPARTCQIYTSNRRTSLRSGPALAVIPLITLSTVISSDKTTAKSRLIAVEFRQRLIRSQ